MRRKAPSREIKLTVLRAVQGYGVRSLFAGHNKVYRESHHICAEEKFVSEFDGFGIESARARATRLSLTYAMSRLDKGDFIVGCKYRIVRKLGSGSFGDIFLGMEISSGVVCFCSM